MVLDIELVHDANSQILVIIRRPFLTTIDATIKVRSGIMTLVFGNMTLNIKIFSNPKADKIEEEHEEACCPKAISLKEVSSLCLNDSVKAVISNSYYYIERYNLQKEEDFLFT